MEAARAEAEAKGVEETRRAVERAVGSAMHEMEASKALELTAVRWPRWGKRGGG